MPFRKPLCSLKTNFSGKYSHMTFQVWHTN